MAGVFFNLHPKRTEGSREPDWKGVLTSSLDESLSALSDGVKEQRPKYISVISRMEDLRNRISLHWGKSNTAIENSDTFIAEVIRPYMQLVSDTRRYFTLPPDELPDSISKEFTSSSSSSSIPVASGGKKYLGFCWKNLFAPSTTLVSGNVNVELVCLLFNLGVLLFNQATATMYSAADPDACKTGFKQFSTAAGVFDQAREMAEHDVPQSQLSFDILPTSFEILRDIALGMGHRCAFIKATQEEATKDKKDLLSKLAMTGAKHLREKCSDRLRTMAEGRTVNDTFRELQKNISDNIALLEGDAYLFVSQIDYAANQTGLVIAKCRVAMAQLNQQATTNSACQSNKDWLLSKCGELRALHDDAVGFNNSVYFKEIPTHIDPLPSMERVLAKPLPYMKSDFSDCDEHSGQPFRGLVGPDIIPLLQSFREQITSEFGKLSKSISQKRNEASEALSRLELDALLCQSEEGQRPELPDTLRKKVRKIQDQAARYGSEMNTTSGNESGSVAMMNPSQMLQAMLRHVANISAATEPILSEATDLLESDDARDKKYIEAYGEKLWRTRIRPSSELPDFPNFRKRISEVRHVVNKEAREVLQGIVKTLNENAQPLLRVGMKLNDLDGLLPVSAAPTKEQQTADSVRNKLRELRANFEAVNETEMKLLRAIPPMISSPDTAAALGAAKKENREDILSKKQVEFIDRFAGVQALATQRDEILEEMETSVLELAKTESDDPMLKEKAAIIKSLERGIQVVEGAVMRISDLSMQLSNMMDVADGLRQNCKSLVAAREIEARSAAGQLDQQLQEQMRRLEQQKQQEQAVKLAQQASQGGGNNSSSSPNSQQQPLHLNMQNHQGTFVDPPSSNNFNNNFNNSNGGMGTPNHSNSSTNFSNHSSPNQMMMPPRQTSTSSVNQLPAEMFDGGSSTSGTSYAPPSFTDPFTTTSSSSQQQQQQPPQTQQGQQQKPAAHNNDWLFQ